jgi:hypothetical protein
LIANLKVSSELATNSLSILKTAMAMIDDRQVTEWLQAARARPSAWDKSNFF